MAKYISGRQKNLKIGISSYSENLTSLDVIGNVIVAGVITATTFNGNVSAGIATLTTLSVGGTTGTSGQYLESTGTGLIWSSFTSLRSVYNYSATEGQKQFVASGINTGYVDVFSNGIRLDDTNYSIIGTGVSLGVGAFSNDEITVVGFNTVNAGGGGGGTSSQTLDQTLALGNSSALGMSVGVITATNFVGNGSGLTGIIAAGTGIIIKDDGALVGTASTIDFGANLSVSPVSAGVVTVTASGGSSGIATYATNAGIATFATTAGIATFATTAGIATFATTAGIATFATNAGIATFATNAGIATFATNAGIATFATNAGIATFATTAGIATNAQGLTGTPNLNVGIVTAISFSGDGSGLTGLVASGTGIIIRDDGTLVGTAGTINFGDNLSVSAISAGVVTVTASGGGGSSQFVTTAAGIHTLSNVGIGTTNPRFTLEVGAVGASGTTLFVNGDARVTGIVTIGPASITLNGSTNIINVGTGITINGSTGIISATAIVLGGTTLTGAAVTFITAGSGISIDQGTGNVTITATGGGGSSQFVTTAAGIHTLSNVGIGTTNPTSKLTVSGNVLVSGIASVTQLNVSGVATVSGGLVVPSSGADFNSGISLRFGNSSEMRVYYYGILNEEQSIIESFSNRPINFKTSSNPATSGDAVTRLSVTNSGINVSGITTTARLNVGTGGTVITTTVSGNVGLGTTNPTSKLTITGDVLATGVVTATTFVGALTGTASNVTTNANLTGDVTSSGNATSIAAGVIVDADVNASAAISLSKLATTGTLTATTFVGALTGTASSATIATYTSEWILGAVGSSDYTFTGPGLIGAESDPVLYLVRGQQYKFTNTMGMHPFRIQSTVNGSTGTAYNEGITNNDVSNGTLTWNVQFDAPNILYYQCTAHAGMGGKIYIIDAGIGPDISINTTGIITASSLTVTGNVSIGGTLTYEDVTNVDSIGLVTARTGVRIDAGGLVVTAGVSTFTSGPVLVGTATSTGTASQPLQVTGGAYVSGSLGIGITNPIGLTTGSAQTLHLNGTTAVLRVGPYYSAGGDRDNILLVADGADTYLRSNNEKFHIYNNSGDILLHGTSDVENIRITASGNVGIGTVTPRTQLDVAGGGYFTGFTNPTSSGRAGLEIGYDGSQGIVQCYDRANNVFKNIKFQGTQHIFSGGNIKVDSGYGIDFSATTDAAGMTSELLSDYEQGTYTPTFGGDSNTYTQSTQTGFYTKIGNYVFVSGAINWTAKSGTSGVTISLPFAINSTVSYRGGGSIGMLTNCTFISATSIVCVQFDGNFSTFNLRFSSNSASWSPFTPNSHMGTSGEFHFSLGYHTN